MDNYNEKKIVVGLLRNKSDIRVYRFSSVYFDTDKKENKSDNDEKFISMFSFILKDRDEIKIFLDTKKFEELFQKDISKLDELLFPSPLLITIHIHDQNKTVSRGIIHTYYSVNLVTDKLIKKENQIYLIIEKRSGDEINIVRDSKENFYSYDLYCKVD